MAPLTANVQKRSALSLPELGRIETYVQEEMVFSL